MENIKERIFSSLLKLYKLEELIFLLDFIRGEQSVLFLLSNEGPLSQSVIQKRLGLAKNRLSAIISNLLNKGLLEKKRSESDKRINIISLTKEGYKIIYEKTEFADKVVNEVLVHFTDSELIELDNIINKMIRIIRKEGYDE